MPTTTGKVSLLYTFKGSQVTGTDLYYSEVEQMPICHYPPGNPDAAHTITVGAPAVGTHIEKHGDTFGPCEGDPNAEPIRIGYSNLDTLFFKTHDLMPGGGLVQKEGSRANDNSQTLEDLFTPFVFDFYDDYKEKYPEFPAEPLPPIEDDTPPLPILDSGALNRSEIVTFDGIHAQGISECDDDEEEPEEEPDTGNPTPTNPNDPVIAEVNIPIRNICIDSDDEDGSGEGEENPDDETGEGDGNPGDGPGDDDGDLTPPDGGDTSEPVDLCDEDTLNALEDAKDDAFDEVFERGKDKDDAKDDMDQKFDDLQDAREDLRQIESDMEDEKREAGDALDEWFDNADTDFAEKFYDCVMDAVGQNPKCVVFRPDLQQEEAAKYEADFRGHLAEARSLSSEASSKRGEITNLEKAYGGARVVFEGAKTDYNEAYGRYTSANRAYKDYKRQYC